MLCSQRAHLVCVRLMAKLFLIVKQDFTIFKTISKMIIQNIIGKPISLELSRHLRDYVDVNDKASVSEKMNVHFNTVNNIIYRKTKINVDNQKVLYELLKVATDRCEAKIIQSKKTKKEFQKYLVL